jgi:hypothetical protein
MSQYGDGETVTVYDETQRKARKSHKCDACHEAIAPGHQYYRTAILFDGSWDTYVRCERCQAIFVHLSKRILDERDQEEFCDQALNCGHSYEENWDEPPPDEIAALAFWRPGDPLPEKSKP